MDAWEAYGNGDDMPEPFDSESDSEAESETEPDEVIILKDSGPFVAGAVYFVAGESSAQDLPFQVRMLRNMCGLSAGDVPWVTGTSEDGRWLLLENGRKLPSDPHLADGCWTKTQQKSMHWELEDPDDPVGALSHRVGKSQHGDVWLEHDGLPFQVRMLRSTCGLRAGDVPWVTGTSHDAKWLLLDNGRRVPYGGHLADRHWTEIKVMDMQHEDKWWLLAAISRCGSTKIWRDQLRERATARASAHGQAAGSTSGHGQAAAAAAAVHPRMARARHVAAARGMSCCQCGVTKADDAFSATQRRRANALRRCSACIAGRV